MVLEVLFRLTSAQDPNLWDSRRLWILLQVIASASKDGSVILWSLEDATWRPLSILKDDFEGQPVWSVEFSQVLLPLDGYPKHNLAI